MTSSTPLRRWSLAAYYLTSAVCLVIGMLVVPNVVRVNALDCTLDDRGCLPKETAAMLWPDLPLPLAYLTLGALCWVVLGSLSIAGLLMFSRTGVPRWLRLSHLIGGVCLICALAADGVLLVAVRRPALGVVFVFVGLFLLVLASIRMRRASPDTLGAHTPAAGGDASI